MDKAKSRVGLPAVLGLLAIVASAAAFWATSAFAADDSSSSSRSSSDDPVAAQGQSDGSDGAAPDGNCPDRGGEPEQSSAA
jgi:hypothetical protein